MVESAELEARDALDRGDRRAAVSVLMRAYGSAVYRHCRIITGDEAMADDVHQTVFVQAWRDIERFAGRSSFKTWLFSIGRNRCLDALKAQRRRRARMPLAGDKAPEGVDETRGADAEMAVEQGKVELETCLQGLAPQVRINLLMRYLEDMSYAEIGRLARERAGTVQARVSRALPVLRKCLEGKGISL